ncbi:MAG TPA: DUF4238 domain-containing protein [Chloroflexota bacterium]|nr:DUF4238 domain-containing protein [Chloroflexota bacterium]
MAKPDPEGRPADIPPEAWDIMKGSAAAASHHWVPRMVLRNFTLHPREDDPEIWCQPVGRGAPRRSRVGAECAIRHHNTLEAATPPPNAIEGVYAYMESAAAEPLRKMLRGEHCDEGDRGALARMIAAQYVRTPRARSAIRYVAEKGRTLQLIASASIEREVLRGRARAQLTERNGEEPTEEAVDAYINDVVNALESGKVRVQASHDLEAGGGLSGLEELAHIIYDMAWVGVRASENMLVLSDHPIVMHDPYGGPDEHVAWLSSGTVEVTLPLATDFCLMLYHRAGPPSYREESMDRRQAEEINLRSIAHAWRHYFGPTQQCVQNARQLAKGHPARIAALQPVPGGMVVAHRIEGAVAPHRVDVHRAPREIKVSRPRKR